MKNRNTRIIQEQIMPEKADLLIVTAASSAYSDSIIGLIGSLNCNWPAHPPVLVYDLGLDKKVLDELRESRVRVRKIPAFCQHWRRHFTWKLWAFHDVPARAYLWLDAGICVLRPMPEVLEQILAHGYFAVPNGLMIGPHMTPGLQHNLQLDSAVLAELPSLTGGVHGFLKEGRGMELLEEALTLAQVEDNLRATAPRQFHEQTLLSVLIQRYFAPVLWADRIVYGADQGGIVSPDQRLWCHRRKLQPDDLAYFRGCLRDRRPPRFPTVPPFPPPPSLLRRIRIRIAKARGRYPERERGSVAYNGIRD